MSIDFQRSWDVTKDGDRSTSAGAFLVQEFADCNAELYGGYRWYDLDQDSRRLDEIHVFNVGARCWFDLTATVPK